MIFYLLLAWSSLAFSIQYYETPCQQNLSSQTAFIDVSTKVQIHSNQVLIRGQLSDFWQQGMEDQIGWLIFDEDFEKQILPSPWVATHFLTTGDQIFILDEQGNVKISGFFDDPYVASKVDILGQEYDVSLNKPILYEDSSLKKVILQSDEFERLFFNKTDAVVIINVDKEQKMRLQKQYTPYYEAYKQHIKNPQRFIQLNTNKNHELAFFQEATFGVPEFTLVPHKKSIVDSLGDFHEEIGERVQIKVKIDNAYQNLDDSAQIILLNDKNEILNTIKLNNIIERYDQNGVDQWPIFTSAKKVLLIRNRR